MQTSVKLKLNQTRLLWGQTAEVTTAITNEGETLLEFLNYDNERGLPTLILTDFQTGGTTEHAQRNLPGTEGSEITVLPGETREFEFRLCYRLQFSSAGSFEIRTRFDWAGGSAESEPVEIEVLPTKPLARHIETTGGGPAGDIFCAWVNEKENRAGLWLSSVGAISEARFQESIRLGDIAVEAQPVLSVPNNTSPTSQYVAWTDGSTLRYAVHTHGHIKTGEISLGDKDYQIIAPLLEDPFCEPYENQKAETLLMREKENGWEMRVVALTDEPQIREPIAVDGPKPRQCYTAYRSDAERRTIFWEQTSFAGEKEAVALSVSNWAKGKNPPIPKLKAAWEGKFVAADQSLTGDDAVLGAVLLHIEAENKNFYEISRWRIDARDNFTELPAIRLEWNPETTISEAVIRIRADECVFALLRSAQDDQWRICSGDGNLKPLKESLQNINGQVNIFFVNQTVPAILYTDPQCGLRFAFEGAAPKRLAPTGL
jgi:hypothetical protein